MSRGVTNGINKSGDKISLPLTFENNKKVIVPMILKPKFIIKTNKIKYGLYKS